MPAVFYPALEFAKVRFPESRSILFLLWVKLGGHGSYYRSKRSSSPDGKMIKMYFNVSARKVSGHPKNRTETAG
jgi:hypothetical protein